MREDGPDLGSNMDVFGTKMAIFYPKSAHRSPLSRPNIREEPGFMGIEG